MTRASAPEREDGSGKGKSVWGCASLISSTSGVASTAFWLAAGRVLPGSSTEHLFAGLAMFVICAAAGCCIVWIREHEQTRRERPQLEVLRALIRIKKRQTKAATRRFWRLRRDDIPNLDYGDGLKELIENCTQPPRPEISGKSDICKNIASNRSRNPYKMP